ncbi:hypothetical protein CRUP_025725 [Coryphaenoides rupestris]|nr:hypothetical protein CRUP_025725 [Coryphaenoides rupestris]
MQVEDVRGCPPHDPLSTTEYDRVRCQESSSVEAHHGCVFVTYELLALDKALTIDTQAVQQEKYQSFIYLKTNHSNDRENFAKGSPDSI